MTKAIFITLLVFLACLIFLYLLVTFIKEGIGLSNINQFFFLGGVYLALEILFYLINGLKISQYPLLLILISLPAIICVVIICVVFFSHSSLQKYADTIVFQNYSHEPIYVDRIDAFVGLRVNLSIKAKDKSNVRLGFPVFFDGIGKRMTSSLGRLSKTGGVFKLREFSYDLYPYPVIKLNTYKKEFCLWENVNIAKIRKPEKIIFLVNGYTGSVDIGGKLLEFIEKNNIDFSEAEKILQESESKIAEKILLCY